MKYYLALIAMLITLAAPAAAHAQMGARIYQPVHLYAYPATDATPMGSIGPNAKCIVEKAVRQTAVADGTVTFYLINVGRYEGWVNAASVHTRQTFVQPNCGHLTGDTDLGGTLQARENQALLQSKLIILSEKLGRPLHLNAGYRSYAEQEKLYNAFLAGHGAPANPPGRSEHQKGNAADVEIGTPAQAKRGNHSIGNNARARRLARQLGLVFPHSDEPWHIELR